MLERLIKAAVCDLYPRAGDLPGIDECDVDAYLAKFREESSPTVYAAVVAGSALYQITPLLTLGKPRFAAQLSTDERDEHAQKIASTDVYAVRQAIFVVKLVAGMCWGQHSKVREKMHLEPYPPDPGTFRTS